MTRQLSFSKNEARILPTFRDKTGTAESIEDLKNIFGYTTRDLFTAVFEGNIAFDHTDIVLNDTEAPHYTVNERLLTKTEFTEIWHSSDLPNITERLAKTAMHRYRHLLKHQEKTNAKIRM